MAIASRTYWPSPTGRGTSLTRSNTVAERIAELEVEEERLLREIGRIGAELSARRREAGERLAAGIEAELEE